MLSHASTEHETREREEYVELDISENNPELSDDVFDQPEPAVPVLDEPNSEQPLLNIHRSTLSKKFPDSYARLHSRNDEYFGEGPVVLCDKEGNENTQRK